jgi:hypothetical protein
MLAEDAIRSLNDEINKLIREKVKKMSGVCLSFALTTPFLLHFRPLGNDIFVLLVVPTMPNPAVSL